MHDRGSGRAGVVLIHDPDRCIGGCPADHGARLLTHQPVPCLPTGPGRQSGRGANDDVIKPVDTALLLRLISMYLYAPPEAGTFEAVGQP